MVLRLLNQKQNQLFFGGFFPVSKYWGTLPGYAKKKVARPVNWDALTPMWRLPSEYAYSFL